MITFEIFEETGPVVSGRGSVTQVTNVNWKRVGDTSNAYYYYPLRRPTSGRDQTLSFKKYIFFKVSGSYSYIKNLKIFITPIDAAQASNYQLFYKFSNVYEEPTDSFDGKMIFSGNQSIVWTPNTSEVSPLQATSRAACVNNKTFYTGYLVTQMRVNQAASSDVGNTAGFEFRLSLHEFE